jgi:hypothetical protein
MVQCGAPRKVECIYKISEHSKYCKARDVYTGYEYVVGDGKLVPWDSELQKMYPTGYPVD